jgi:hypothetical protein
MSETAPALEGLSIYDALETDASAEEDGRWFNDFLGAAAKGDIKLRSFTSRKSIDVRNQLDMQNVRLMKPDGTWPREVSQKLLIEHLAQAIIVDWRGAAFRSKDGKEIPYSIDAARELLTRLPHFRMRVGALANRLEGFQAENQADVEKN